MRDIQWNLGARLIAAVIAVGAGMAGTAQAQAQAPATRQIQGLADLNGAMESLVERVSQSVVQVVVTSYGPVDDDSRTNTDLIIGRQRSTGSGVVIDRGGYIITNAHVVSNARRVEVVLPGGPGEAPGAPLPGIGRGRRVDATIVGMAREIDLALLKVDVTDLPALPIANYDKVRQGALVFAFGSPEGLRNSATMGIISAVARQSDPDNPLVYIQTDAPINHGSSGGPLVNVNGELVGINTFVMNESGNRGLGFAIPGMLVQMAYPKLRQYGHMHRGEVGVLLQTITPTLAQGLGLGQDFGTMISDVAAGGPAEAAGLRPEDIVLTVDGEPVDALPRIAFILFTRSAGDTVTFGVLRGKERLTARVAVVERPHDFDRLSDLVDPEKSLVPKLGIVGVDITEANAGMSGGLANPTGVIVVGHTKDDSDAADAGLQTGDAIHAMNGQPLLSVEQLRTGLDALTRRSPVVLEIERRGQRVFLAFEIE
jgi:serine protease Do